MFQSFRPSNFMRRILRRTASTGSTGTTSGEGSAQLPKENVNVFQMVGRFLGKNKQQIMNMIGIYFCFSVAIHNYKMKIAWDEREKEVQKIKSKLSLFETAFVSETKWVEDAEQRVLKAGNRQKGILMEEIMKKISPLIKDNNTNSSDGNVHSKVNSVVNTVENTKGKLL